MSIHSFWMAIYAAAISRGSTSVVARSTANQAVIDFKALDVDALRPE